MVDLVPGEYDVTIVTPLGYSVSSNTVHVVVPGGGAVTADFSLSCLAFCRKARAVMAIGSTRWAWPLA